MKLHDLQIEGFGHFHDFSLGPLDSNLAVLHGPNEAGKSTLLAFIRTILFGFPTRGRDQHFPPLSGGRHGGRIALEDDQGTRYTLERFAGPRGGRYQLWTVCEERRGKQVALERLTGHATLDLFSNVFAFSLDEMQNEGLMDDSEVSGRLYSAGMGASGLLEFVGDLASRRDELFRPRGSAQTIAKLLRELNDIDGQLLTVQNNADKYRDLASRQGAILTELQATDDDIAKLNKRVAETKRLLEAWNDWVALERLESKLRDIPVFERFPDSPIERLENLESRVREARQDRDESEGELDTISEAAETPITDEDLLDDAERIEAIRRARSRFDGSVRDLPQRHDELREMEEGLSDRIRELGKGWDETRLDDLDTSLAVRQQVEVWRDRLNESGNKARDATVKLEQSRERLGELRAEEVLAQGRLIVDSSARHHSGPQPASGRLEELLNDQEEIERVRRGGGSFDDSVRDLPERQAELSAQEADISRQLRDLGNGWDEAKLEGFDTSMVFRHEVDSFLQVLAEQAERRRRIGERLEREASELVECRAAVDEAQARVPVERPPLDAREIELRRSALRTARSRRSDHDRVSINLENLRAQLASLIGGRESGGSASERPAALVPILVGVIGIGLMLAGVFLGQESLPFGLVAGTVLLGFGAYLLYRRPQMPSVVANPLIAAFDQNVTDAQAEVETAMALLVEAAQPLTLDDSPTADALDNAEAGLEAASRDLSAWDQANDRIEETKVALRAQEQRVEEAKEQAKSTVEAEDTSKKQWRQWLVRHGLDEGLTPETVVVLSGRIDTMRAVLQNLHQMRQRVAAIQVDIDQFKDQVSALAWRHGIQLDDHSHERIMAVADMLIESLDSVRQHVVQRDNVLDRLGQQKQAKVAADEEHTRASQDLEGRQSEWRGWLQKRGLNESFTPDALLEFLARVEIAHSSRTETCRMRSRVAAIEAAISQFRGQVRPLAETHGIKLDTADPIQLATAADTLINRLERVKEQVYERQQASQRQTEQRRRLKQLQQRLNLARRDLAALLAEGDAEDAEVFRRRAALNERRQGLETEREERLRSLTRLSGPDERLAVFRDSLAASDPDQLRAELGVLSEQIAARSDRRNELREERGRNGSEIDRLTGEVESSELRIRRNVLMEQLRENAREWSRLNIARAILEKTRRKFEQERQPGVILQAEEFFSNVTGQRYKRLYAPVGERTITVTDSSGRDKRPSELSRGTREQLYLALRFGLIREFGEHAERLPVVVDEALVNFDSNRASLAAASFAKLADTNQVLVFTCHRATIDAFVDVGARVVEIDRKETLTNSG